MALKVHELEGELFSTRKNLELTQDALRKEKEERIANNKEKDVIIDELTEKNRKCEVSYDNILQLTLDNFITRVEARKAQVWEPNSETLQAKNKLLLAELGFKIHDI